MVDVLYWASCHLTKNIFQVTHCTSTGMNIHRLGQVNYANYFKKYSSSDIKKITLADVSTDSISGGSQLRCGMVQFCGQ